MVRWCVGRKYSEAFLALYKLCLSRRWSGFWYCCCFFFCSTHLMRAQWLSLAHEQELWSCTTKQTLCWTRRSWLRQRSVVWWFVCGGRGWALRWCLNGVSLVDWRSAPQPHSWIPSLSAFTPTAATTLTPWRGSSRLISRYFNVLKAAYLEVFILRVYTVYATVH